MWQHVGKKIMVKRTKIIPPSVKNCTKVVVAITDIKKSFQSTKSLNVVFTVHCAYNGALLFDRKLYKTK